MIQPYKRISNDEMEKNNEGYKRDTTFIWLNNQPFKNEEQLSELFSGNNVGNKFWTTFDSSNGLKI